MKHDDVTDEDIMELIQSKGKALEGFKREYLELKKQYDLVEGNVVAKERELEVINAEIFSTRDQISFIHRNVDEILSSQTALKVATEHMSSRRSNLIEKEMSNRDEIAVFTGFSEELKSALSIGASWTPEQLDQKQILEKDVDFSSGKLESILANVNGLRREVDRIYDCIQQLEKDISEKDDSLVNIGSKTKDYQGKAKDLMKTREEREQKVFEVRAAIVQAETNLAERRRTQKGEDRSLQDLDANLAASKEQMEVYLTQYDSLYKTLQDLTADLERQKSQNAAVEEDIAAKKTALDERRRDIDAFVKEMTKVSQLRDLAKAKCAEIDTEKNVTEEKRDALTKRIQQLSMLEVISLGKQIELADNQLGQHHRELEIIHKKQAGTERATRTMQDLLQLNINGKKNLSQEQKMLEDDVNLQKEQIRLLLAEKERYEHDAEIMNQQYYTALEELKLQELQVQELQKKMMDDQAKLKHKQNLYDAVRSDRNLYSKQLIDSQEEINGLRRKFRGMNHLIEQLKDEISVKDHAIVKEHFLHHSVDKEKELLKNELMKIRKQVLSSESIVENQRVEILKLTRIIDEAEQERARQRNELSSVISERNLLTSQVVKRNFELGNMYDRIKIQRSNLRIGQSNFHRVMQGIAAWQRQLITVVGDQSDTIAGLAGMDELRNKVVRLQRDLLTEQTRTRALVDELDRPMNVHRWRVLESSDPKRFEKITLIQALQKQIISKSDDVTRCDLLIQEKEKVYVELKNIISRQPGPEVEEQILVYQQTLKDKVKQLTSMDDELDMYRQQVGVFKEQISEVDNDLLKVKKRWFKIKKAQDAAIAMGSKTQ